jgi:hypothetical protein
MKTPKMHCKQAFAVKGLTFGAVLWLIAGMLAAPAKAQRTVSVQPPATSASPSSLFALMVSIDDASSVAGFQFDLVYNGSVITHADGEDSPRPGSLLAGKRWTIASNQVDPNRLRVLGYHIPTTELPPGPGSLVEFDFNAGASPGMTAVNLEGVVLSDGLARRIPAVGVGGCVRVGTCDDQNPCTTDSMNPANCECIHAPKNCDDANPCTNDSCDPATGQCLHTPKNCDDGLPCTDDTCDPATGQCVHTPKNCDDGNACTTDTCDPATGQCLHTPKNCDDGVPCTDDTCDPATGQCLHTPKNCDDGFSCTADSCDPATGQCLHTPNHAVCEDGKLCTTDTCDPLIGRPRTGCANTPKNCDDQNACTADSCNSKTGQCVNTPKNCDDRDPCTIDTCNPVTGQCVHTPSGLVEVGITNFSVPPKAKTGQNATLNVSIKSTGCTDTWVLCTVTKPGQTIGAQNVWVTKGSTSTAGFAYTYSAGDMPSVCFTATISAAGDVNPANNQATVCTRVTR